MRQRLNLTMVVRLLLVAITLIVYAQAFGYGFINYDDDRYMTGNSRVQSGFTWENIRWAFTTGYFSNWHPLTWLSHMLDFRLFGLHAGPQHVENILFHILNVLLVFEIVAQASSLRLCSSRLEACATTAAVGRAAFVAALFAVHPLHVESVVWIAERKDVLSTFFALLAAWNYVAYVETGSRGRYGLVLLCFAFSLMAKSMLVTLPCVLLLLDFWPLGRLNAANAKKIILEKVLLFEMAFIAGVVALLFKSPQTASFYGRVANTFYSYVMYIYKSVIPTGLIVFYPHRGDQLPLWRVGLFAMMLLAVTGAVFLWRRKKPYLLMGWLWYGITLAPASGFVQVGEHGLADRYTYFPSIGLYILAAWGGLDLARFLRIPLKAVAGVAAAVVAVFMALGVVQVYHWRDCESLWIHTLAVMPDNAVAHVKLGNTFAVQKRLDEAQRQYQEAIRVGPDDPGGYVNMAMLRLAAGGFEEAMQQLQLALRVDPSNVAAHINMGIALDSLGRHDEADAEFEAALKSDPVNVQAHLNYGTALFMRQRYEEAARHFLATLKEAPNDHQALFGAGASLFHAGKYQDAMPYLRKLLNCEPDNQEARQYIEQIERK